MITLSLSRMAVSLALARSARVGVGHADADHRRVGVLHPHGARRRWACRSNGLRGLHRARGPETVSVVRVGGPAMPVKPLATLTVRVTTRRSRRVTARCPKRPEG